MQLGVAFAGCRDVTWCTEGCTSVYRGGTWGTTQVKELTNLKRLKRFEYMYIVVLDEVFMENKK